MAKIAALRRSLASPRVTPLSVGVVVVALGAVVLSITHLRPVTDAVVYRFGAELIVVSPDDLYVASSSNALPFTYPPFAALLFVPLAMVSDAVATVLVSIATIAALLRVSALVWPRAFVEVGIVDRGHLARQRAIATAAVALTPLAFALEPVWETLKYGQINVVLCWLVVEDLLAPRSRRWRGVLVGVATGVKLTPGVFIGLQAIGRRWRDVGLAAVTTVGTVAIGFIAAPRASWDYWFGGVLGADRVGAAEFGGNQSLNGLTWRLVGEGGSAGVWIAAAVVVVAGGAFVARRWWKRGGIVAAMVAVALAGLLVSPVSWSHHWVWVWVLIPVGVATVAGARQSRFGALMASGVALGVGWFVSATFRAVWWFPTGAGIEFGRGVVPAVMSSP